MSRCTTLDSQGKPPVGHRVVTHHSERRYKPEAERRGEIIGGIQSRIDDRHVTQCGVYTGKQRESVPDLYIAFGTSTLGGILHPVE